MSTLIKSAIGGLFFSSVATCSSLVMAAGGVVYFSGAITEPACSVQMQTIVLTTLSTSQNGSQIPLNVHCNANQNVQISLSDAGTPTGGKSFSTGVNGASVIVSHKAKLIGPGDKINYSFDGKKDVQVPLTAMLRKAANLTNETMHSSVLVSLEYQ